MSDNNVAHGVDCDSITGPSEAGGSISANSCRKRKSKSGSVFKAWHFQIMFKADLRNASTSVEKGISSQNISEAAQDIPGRSLSLVW
jgi:hypothetical protein